MGEQSSVQLLLIEDDAIDAELFRRSVKKAELDCPIVHATDGAEGIARLREHANDKYLVFLDLNMPGINGHGFLDAVRKDDQLKSSIVFVLTSSTHDRDVQRAYAKNVAGYFNKSDVASLMEVTKKYAQLVHFPCGNA